jgi:hypothetical protein
MRLLLGQKNTIGAQSQREGIDIAADVDIAVDGVSQFSYSEGRCLEGRTVHDTVCLQILLDNGVDESARVDPRG